MKSILKGLSSVAIAGIVATTTVSAQTPPTATPTPAPSTPMKTAGDSKEVKDLKKQLQDQGITVNYVETAQKGITLSGYVDTSYTYQFASAGQFGTGSKADLRQFDLYNNNFNVDAVKIALEKALPDKNEYAAGFRIDTIYGSDAKFLNDKTFNQSFPATTGASSGSDFALEQAFVKFRVPLGNGVDFQFGKFVTLLGYEVIESPSNPNFSRGLLFTNAIPLTHTGLLASYKINSTIDFKVGIVDGWNNSQSTSPNEIGFVDKSSFGKCLTGQLNLNSAGGNANIAQSFVYSPDGEPGVDGVDNGPMAVYDIWGNWKPLYLKDQNLTLGFNVDVGYNGASGAPNGTVVAESPNELSKDTNTWYGVALYSLYQFKSDNWKWLSLAGRAEYLHSDSAYLPKYGVPGFNTSGPGGTVVPWGAQDDYSYTATANFTIWDNLLTRMEYRIDDLHGGATSLPGHADLQHEISLNAVYSF